MSPTQAGLSADYGSPMVPGAQNFRALLAFPALVPAQSLYPSGPSPRVVLPVMAPSLLAQVPLRGPGLMVRGKGCSSSLSHFARVASSCDSAAPSCWKS